MIGFLLIALSGKRLVKGFAALIGCAAVFVAFCFALTLFIKLLNGSAPIEATMYRWIGAGNFSANIGFLIDPLSSLMLLVITGVGFLIHVYSVGYMHDDEGFNRFFSYLNLFRLLHAPSCDGEQLLGDVCWMGRCWTLFLFADWILVYRNQDYNASSE
ncbi:MAG: hypothetical protein QM734_15835 [Cyclobacteriaceae bacterium]